MTQSSETDAVIRTVYDHLQNKNYAEVLNRFDEDIDFRIVRPMPLKHVKGRDAVAAYFDRIKDWTPLDGEIVLETVATSGEYGFSVHVEAKDTPREHRHVMVWQIADGGVKALWELTLGGPPPVHGMDVAAIERSGGMLLVLEPD